MVLLDVLASEANELLVVSTFEPVTARTIDRTHLYSFLLLNAFTVVPRAPYF
jgi:hypothetical protein